MILLKVCHINFDLYGLNIFVKDLMDVYNALCNNSDLPKAPLPFENVLIKDLEHKNDKEYFEKNREFFDNYLRSKSQPYYAGLHGKKANITLR